MARGIPFPELMTYPTPAIRQPTIEQVRKAIREGERELAIEIERLKIDLPHWSPELDRIRITI